MRRRIAGLSILIIACLLTVIFTKLADHGSTSVHDEPPPVGTCVDLVADGLRPVPCDRMHDGEVAVAWPVADVADATVGGACTDAASSALQRVPRNAGSAWSAGPLHFASAVVSGSISDHRGKHDWVTCVVTAGGRRYLGSALAATESSAVPAEFRLCSTVTGPVSCAYLHTTETLATASGTASHDPRWGSPFLARVPEILTASCLRVAAELTGTADPTYQGALSVKVALSGLHSTAATGTASWSVDYTADCQVTSTGRPLNASMVGWGSMAPPVG